MTLLHGEVPRGRSVAARGRTARAGAATARSTASARVTNVTLLSSCESGTTRSRRGRAVSSSGSAGPRREWIRLTILATARESGTSTALGPVRAAIWSCARPPWTRRGARAAFCSSTTRRYLPVVQWNS
jgi:hypothetical protein